MARVSEQIALDADDTRPLTGLWRNPTVREVTRAEGGNAMKLARIVAVAVVSVCLLSSAPALADPPPTHNRNTVIWTFHCSRGADTLSFEAIGISQSAQIALQLLDRNGVVVFTHVEVNGQVAYDVPGQAHRSDLWTCTIEGFTGVIAQVFLTPRG